MTELRYCSHCGRQIDENDAYCPHCGAKIEKEESNYDSRYEPKENQSYQSGNYQGLENKNTNTNDTLTLVFGILSIVLGGILWTILTFVFAAKADPNDQKTKIGKMLAVIGCVLWAVLLIIQISLIFSR